MEIAKRVLKDLNWDYDKITTAPRLGYLEYGKSGKPLIWEAMAKAIQFVRDLFMNVGGIGQVEIDPKSDSVFGVKVILTPH